MPLDRVAESVDVIGTSVWSTSRRVDVAAASCSLDTVDVLDITAVGKVSAFKIAVSEALAASTDVLVRLVGISAASSNDDEVAI